MRPDVSVRAVEDVVGRLSRERILDAEEHRKLHVRPDVQRVADGGLDAVRIGAELLARGRVAGDQALRHAAGAHQAPFVVVAAEPDLRDVREDLVLEDLLRRKVAVVVDDRQGADGFIQPLCRAAFQK